MIKISQREARRLHKRVGELEKLLADQKSYWLKQWPGGVHLGSISVNETEWAIICTARKLGHACVIVPFSKGQIEIYAEPLP